MLLHGWGASASLVWPLAAKLAERGLSVCAVDLPGFGQRPHPLSHGVLLTMRHGYCA